MKIIRGRVGGAKKIVVYGPEGIGKSTFAAQFPDPVFIDTEGSTKDMDVARFDKATSWAMLLQQVKYVLEHSDVCRTLVIDTADWAEQLEIQSLCEQKGWTGLEDAGYGKGYTYSAETFGRFLNMLEEVTEKGIHVVMTAHAQLRKVELPEEMCAYDHWEMKTSKKVAPMIREWADAVFFANYKTRVIEVDKKKKAQGGQRVMYTVHTPFWDAKNRYGLPDEMPFDYEGIRSILESDSESRKAADSREDAAGKPGSRQIKNTDKRPAKDPGKSAEKEKDTEIRQGSESLKTIPKDPGKEEPLAAGEKAAQAPPLQDNPGEEKRERDPDKRIPKALRDLMIAGDVDEWDIQNVVNARQPGVFPFDMPVKDYPQDFVNEWIIPNWGRILEYIADMKEKEEIPF